MISKIEIPIETDKSEGLKSLNRYLSCLNNGWNPRSDELEKSYKLIKNALENGKITEKDRMLPGTKLILDYHPLNANSDLDNMQFVTKAFIDAWSGFYMILDEDGKYNGYSYYPQHQKGEHKVETSPYPFLSNDNVKNIACMSSVYTENSTKGYPYVNLYWTNNMEDFKELTNLLTSISLSNENIKDSKSKIYTLTKKEA